MHLKIAPREVCKPLDPDDEDYDDEDPVPAEDDPHENLIPGCTELHDDEESALAEDGSYSHFLNTHLAKCTSHLTYEPLNPDNED